MDIDGEHVFVICSNSRIVNRRTGELMRNWRAKRLEWRPGFPPDKETSMAKSQKKSNREVRKPKAEKAPKANASNPSTKQNPVGIVTLKS